MPRRGFEDVLCHSGRTCVENLVESLRKTHIRNVVTAVYHGHVFLRKCFGNHLPQRARARRGFGACFYHRRIAAADTRRQNAQGQKNREVEGADNQRNAIRHFVYRRQDTRKAHQSAEMHFRLRPFFQTAKNLVDLHNHRPDVAEIRLRRAFSEILIKRFLEYFPVGNYRLPQSPELRHTPFDIECLSRAEISSLCG